jgi:ribonuclease BN (tRNA processing enzyme)
MLMTNKLTILGSGTCNLIANKAAASVLIEKNSMRLVYDFGRGVATRLAECGLKQDDVEYIFISHFHPDHVTDLYPYLHAASWSHVDSRTKDLTIYGPKGTEEFLKKMFSIFGQNQLSRNFTVHVRDVEGEINIAGETISVEDLQHSHGLRINKIAIAGDASLNDSLVRLLNSTELAVFDAGHLTDKEICELATATQVEKLICSHQYRVLDEVKLNASAKKMGFDGTLVVANDFMKFEF